MQKRIEVKKSHSDQDTVYLTSELFDGEITQASATGQMITDSDHVSFIYLVDINDQFTYVSLTKEVWPHLKEVLTHNKNVKLTINETEIELPGVKEELSYLVENIEGNANYGDDMVNEVERVFLDKEEQ
ncbi:hypothetical protein [Priestia koreensis]|uniref:UPF0738 family protein n=1 Tax=Priestia koreensis TaxID=284581 RepID=UPI00345A19CB